MGKSIDKSQKAIRVLFVAAEADPIIKVGGLGDVTGSLPRALRNLVPAQISGHVLDVRLAIPFHAAIKTRIKDPEFVTSFDVPSHSGPISAQTYLTYIGDLPVYLIDGTPIPPDGPVYNNDTRKDGDKFIFFSLAVLELARALDWQPDILHANDWHTAIAIYDLMLRRSDEAFFENTRSLLTVHNLPYMGAGTDEALAYFDIPPLHDPRLPDWGAYQPLPMGLASADFITTVSPTYAQEIMTPAFGCGLDDFLRQRSKNMVGILNGLDEVAWNPATDKALIENYDRETLSKRAANKKALLEEFSLPPKLDFPLMIMIGRMDYQKGIDLALDGLREISELPWQAIFLGTGDPLMEAKAHELEIEMPFRVRAALRFDIKLSHRMYAGGDMLLMPSRYEPCGLTQMIAMRYGCVPVARATGGLCDTIIDQPSPEKSTGFLFQEATPESTADGLRRAITAYARHDTWQLRQEYAMQQNFSLQHMAEAYAQIYIRLHAT